MALFVSGTYHFVKMEYGFEKCGFIYSHTEDNKPVPLLNEVRTEHFTKITLKDWKNNEDWKNNIDNLK